MFYDINLEVAEILPHAKSASEINATSNGATISQLASKIQGQNSVRDKTQAEIAELESEVSELENIKKDKISPKSNIGGLSQELISVKKKFDAILDLYDEIQDDFRVTFHCFAKDVFIDLVDDEPE